jgi:hypothetical protein
MNWIACSANWTCDKVVDWKAVYAGCERINPSWRTGTGLLEELHRLDMGLLAGAGAGKAYGICPEPENDDDSVGVEGEPEPDDSAGGVGRPHDHSVLH